jgi:hypothetical protein
MPRVTRGMRGGEGYAMSRLHLRLGRSVLVGIAALGLVTTTAVLAGSGISGASRFAPRGERAVKLDHFLCYAATGPNFAVPTNVGLQNLLNPTRISPTFVRVSALCNPAIKRVISPSATANFKVVHPNAHLVCWSIVYGNKPQSVVLANQFGKATMVAGSPTKFCVPSWMSKKGVPSKKPDAPPNLDHFTCYPLTMSSATTYGFKAPGVLKVEDAFSFPKFEVVKIGLANQLCVPTTKYLPGVVFAPVSTADLSLVCFPVNKTPVWKIAYAENQFGGAAVFPSAPPEELCLPSSASLSPSSSG